ncbi:hypothetical protein L208DRAFT_1376586 [Tricholoma matsutake]|nr:hypothetical protein L208DRAFT_1376586 [Tricholoma matsutake 945]
MTETYSYLTTGLEILLQGNYHSWAPTTIAKLCEARVWLNVSGADPDPGNPTTPSSDADAATKCKYKANLKDCQAWLHRDDHAISIIISLLDKNHQQTFTSEGLTLKALWDKIKEEHKNENTGLAAFFIKHGIIKKCFNLDGVDPGSKTLFSLTQAHLNHLILENKKLGDKAFDDEFVAQLILMSLPHHTTWETLVVSLLQNSTKLTVTDVTAHLLSEAQHLDEDHDGSLSSSSALLAHRDKHNASKSYSQDHSPSKPKSTSSNSPSSSHSGLTQQCDYCYCSEHLGEKCWELSRDIERDKLRAKMKEKGECANLTDDDSEQAKLAASFWEDFRAESCCDDDDVHVL